MNLFKGLLYLIENDPPASPVLIEVRHYGAATAANEFAGPLGNGAASRRRFGAREDNGASQDARIAATGGCR
jgi:hypothetical protein